MTARVRLDQLPPKVRAQVLAQLDTRPRRSRGSAGTVRGGKWRCHTCGTVSTTWTGAQRHADTEGHRRIDCVLDGLGGDAA